MRDDQPRHLLAAERLGEDAPPQLPGDRRVEPAIDDGPAVTIGEQPEIDMVEGERQRHAQPMDARRDLRQRARRRRRRVREAQGGDAAVARRHASQTRSRMAAMPWPTPMHMVTRAYRPPLRCSSRIAVRPRRAPEAPSGWPMAIAPPFGLTRESSASILSSLRQPRTCVAKASLSSMTSISLRARPARSSAFCEAGTGPSPITRGSTPATAAETMRAIGFAPDFSTIASVPMISAAAPSLIPEALPAVTGPPA